VAVIKGIRWSHPCCATCSNALSLRLPCHKPRVHFIVFNPPPQYLATGQRLNPLPLPSLSSAPYPPASAQRADGVGRWGSAWPAPVGRGYRGPRGACPGTSPAVWQSNSRSPLARRFGLRKGRDAWCDDGVAWSRESRPPRMGYRPKKLQSGVRPRLVGP
jgi:hypothetical protein